MFTAKIKIMTEALFQDLFKRQKESGLTVRVFCANEGIAPSTYYYWLKKCKTKAVQSNGFIPLIPGSYQFPSLKRNHPSQFTPASREYDSPALLELIFPNGTVLKVKNQVDLSLLQNLVHLYG